MDDRRTGADESVNDQDFKYILQDTGSLYLGARHCYSELLEEEMLAFKMKTIIMQYILKDVDRLTSLESHFYYMTGGDFSYRTYMELKSKVKVSLPEEKRGLTGKVSCIYNERIYTLKEFAQIKPEQKKANHMIIREIIISKLGLLSFTV